jgi:hypothetical protein
LSAHIVDSTFKEETEPVGRFSDNFVRPHIWRRFASRSGVKSETFNLLGFRLVDESDTEPTDPAHLRVNHALNQRCCHRCIHSVSALPQNFDPFLNCQDLRRNDQASHSSSPLCVMRKA